MTREGDRGCSIVVRSVLFPKIHEETPLLRSSTGLATNYLNRELTLTGLTFSYVHGWKLFGTAQG